MKWGSALALTAVMLVDSIGILPTGGYESVHKVGAAGTEWNSEMWDGSKANSVGKKTTQAILNGENIQILDTSEGGVLSIGEGSYLELPVDLLEGVKDGFTITYKVKPDKDCSKEANVFQSNISGYKTGDEYWKDAPELAWKVGGEYVSYVGGRVINGVYHNNATYNNGVGSDDKNYAEPNGHKTRYKAETTALLNDKWNDVRISVSKTGVTMVVNGKQQTIKAKDSSFQLQSNLQYLFSNLNMQGEKQAWIQEYVFSSIGGSVYANAEEFKGLVDDVTVYKRALEQEQLLALPEDADYKWTFEKNTLEASDTASYVSDLTKYDHEISLEKMEALSTVSPDGKTEICIWRDGQNQYYYSVTRDNKVMIESSLIGIVLDEGNLSQGLTCDVENTQITQIDEQYSNISGKKSISYDKCNERKIRFSNGDASMDFVIRAYDDGFAYRYENVCAANASELTVKQEKSEFILSDKASTWAFPLNGTYEGEFVKRNHKTLVSTQERFSTPVLAKMEDYWILFSEANVFNNKGDYCSSALETKKGSKHLSWTFGDARDPANESTGDLDSPGHIQIQKVTTRNGFSTPWRAAIISNNLNTFYNSDMIANLNPKPDESLYADTSWIKPGKVAWSWWAEDEAQGDYNKHVEYIDFAAKNGWEYVCLDVGWNAFEERLPELCAYAKSKGVGIFVWINYRDMKTHKQVDDKFEKWAQAGAVGIKADYFESDEQQVLEIMDYAAQKSAKEKLMILYHGCVRPAGEYRSYPNVLSMEAVQGEEWHKWFAYPTAQNCLLYPFTRNILGSMDYTPAATKIGAAGTTYGFSMAQTIVYESGLQHFANAASLYKKYNGLSLLNHIPTIWSESQILDGFPGKYVTVLRKNQEDYFIGAMTVDSRQLKLSLDFLGEGKYNAYIYRDNKDGSGLTVTKTTVTRQGNIEETLLKNGGVAIMLTKKEININVADSQEADSPDYTYYEAESKNNTMMGTVGISTAVFCSGAQKVGFIGLGAKNRLTFEQISVPEDGWYDLRLYYCTAQTRKVYIQVNANKQYELGNLNSGSFTKPKMANIKVQLKKGMNSICFYNNAAYAPDMDRIAVSKKALPDSSSTNKPNHTTNKDNITTGKKIRPSKVTIRKNTASNQKAIYIKKGRKITLKAIVKPAKAINSITWKSTKPLIASVKNGKVKAKKAGTTYIQLKELKGKKIYAQVKLVVQKKEVKTKKIKAAKKVYTVKRKKSITIKTNIKPVNSTAAISFKVKDKKIAKVDSETGVVTGKKKGTTKCTIKTNDGKRFIVKIKVK